MARSFCRVPMTGVKDVPDGSAAPPMLAFACPSWLATRTAEGPALTVPSSLHVVSCHGEHAGAESGVRCEELVCACRKQTRCQGC